MPHSVIEPLDRFLLAFDSSEENRIRKIIAVGQGHRFGAVERARRVEVAHDSPRLVFSHAETQRQQVLDRVGAPLADSCGQHSNNAAFRRGEFRCTHRESRFDAPGLLGAGESHVVSRILSLRGVMGFFDAVAHLIRVLF